MKKLFTILLLCLPATAAFAQRSADSIAYEAQRQKINSMLEARSVKFGQYDQSLSMHTGIFGLQTKKDIRRSNDILMDIVRTDEEIFKQTKILLEYRTFQQTQAQTQSTQAQSTTLAYMNTINKLRDQLDKVKKEAAADQKEQLNLVRLLFIITGLLLLAIVLIARRKPGIKI